VKSFLAGLGRRARLIAAREAFLDALFWASFAAASLLLADRIRMEAGAGGVPLSDGRGIAVALGGALVVALASAAVRHARFRPSEGDLARAADRRLGLEDRIATAGERMAGEFGPLLDRQAAEAVRGVHPRRVFPVPTLGSRAWTIGAVATALLLLLIPFPEARRETAARQRREREAGAAAAGQDGGGRSSGGGAPAAGASAGGDVRTGVPRGGGRSTRPPPLFGDPERGHFQKRPEHVSPILGQGDWKPSGTAVDGGAAAAGAPGAATEPERLAAYRKQAEAFVGRDGFPEGDREIVRTYFDRVAPR